MPAVTPVSIPDDALILVLPLLVLQVPPGVGELNVVVAASQMFILPDMAAGVVFTVTVVAAMHPPVKEYVISDVPAAFPVTTPLATSIVAFVLLLLHVPPVIVFDSVVVAPSHTTAVPVIGDGVAYTVTVVVA